MIKLPYICTCNGGINITINVVSVGFIFMSSFALFFLFWLFHILHMFGSVAFPFKFQRWVESTGHKRRTYFAEMMFILICAFLPAILAASTSGYQFFGFPPVCFSTSGPLVFYAFLLPLTLGSTVTLNVMFASFWILRRVCTDWSVFLSV